jgi:DNA polymerase III gamma/tau subunit
MTKRKPVLVLFIITAIILIAGVVLFAIPTLFTTGSDLSVTFADLNGGIINALTGKNMVGNIVSLALSVVVFVLIPLIVHIKRKQHSVTILLLLGALVMLYVELLLLSYTEIKAPLIEQITKDQAAMQELIKKGLFFVIGLGLISLAGILELVIFIVDMVIRVKREPQAVPTAQEMREEAKEEPAQVVEPEAKEEEPAPVVAAPNEEPEAEEELKLEEEPEEEEPEEEAEEEEEQLAEEAEEAKEEPAPAKKAPAKKQEKNAPAKKEEKKAPAKKAASRETTTIKKPASRETTTIKKPARETQTVKKAEILTNEEGKQFVKAYHVSQRKELKKWQVKGAGSEKAVKLFDTQKEAIEYANQLAANNGAAVRVHSRAGKMRKA